MEQLLKKFTVAPEKCQSLILVSTYHFAPLHLGKLLLHFRKVRSLFLNTNQEKLMTARTCLYSWKEKNVEEFYNNYKPNNIGYKKALRACFDVDNRRLLPKTKVPTLIIGGQYDSILPIWIQIHMNKQIPNSELVIFKNCGHIAKYEVSNEFNETLSLFLNIHRLVTN
ncbi:alpha/beta hydrolase [Neobacillus pocheonensis]|uniref:Alpha/beta hydrolase n=1 Tax=Neobacillus pocheonensis TaxID=363869 RepID=A0ABT0WGX7_9BACI|nr:alpha/beta hydrolase [Neobacillus pocheonensis]